VTGFRGGSDLFVAKYDITGTLVWATSVAGTGDDCSAIGQASCLVGLAIAVDGLGNSYVTGLFNGTATNPTIFGPGEPNQTPLISAGGTDVFVAKYDSTGKLVWAKRAGGAGDDHGGGIAVDGLGNSYVTGVGAITRANMFVTKYDSTGSLVWAKSASGNFQVGAGVALDGLGNIYVAGDYSGIATNPSIFGPGEPNQTQLIHVEPRDIFVAKYDSTGNLIWAKSVGKGGGSDSSRGIALDGSGNSYVTGVYQGTATNPTIFGSGEPNQTQLIAAGGGDIFVAKFDSTGSLVWVKSAGGSIDIPANQDFGFGIGVDSSGNSYVTGRFQGTATNPAIFGLGEPNETQLSGTAGPLHMFIAKFAGDPDGDLADFFLHGSGATANPSTLFLNGDPPTATTAKSKDSAAIKFSGGNPWTQIGAWTAQPALSSGTVSALSNLRTWIGLKNSYDQGTRFDLRAEVYKNSTIVASGEIFCIQGVTRNADQAKEVAVSFNSPSPMTFNGTTDVLSLKVLTRIGTNGSGAFCGGHSNAVGLRLYFDAVSRPSKFTATFDQ
jgi:Beta-propeller repeat